MTAGRGRGARRAHRRLRAGRPVADAAWSASPTPAGGACAAGVRRQRPSRRMRALGDAARRRPARAVHRGRLLRVRRRRPRPRGRPAAATTVRGDDRGGRGPALDLSPAGPARRWRVLDGAGRARRATWRDAAPAVRPAPTHWSRHRARGDPDAPGGRAPWLAAGATPVSTGPPRSAARGGAGGRAVPPADRRRRRRPRARSRIVAVTKGFGPEAVGAPRSAPASPTSARTTPRSWWPRPTGWRPGDAPPSAGTSSAGCSATRSAAAPARVACGRASTGPSWCDEIARRAPGAAVLVQVNVERRAAEGGCAPADAAGAGGPARDAGPRRRGPDGGRRPPVPPRGRSAGLRRAARPGRRPRPARCGRWA